VDYRVYGLTLASSDPLPHAIGASSERPPDVRFELGRLPGGDQAVTDYAGPHGRLSFALDRQGTRVWGEYSEDTSIRSGDDVAALLLGSVMGAVLRRRRLISLHGCVVEVASRAVALLGAAGAGKSTLATALAQRGHPVLSDDVAAIDARGFAQPGYPRLRVAPATLAALSPRSPVGSAVGTGVDKRYVELAVDAPAGAWRFQPRPLPLAAIYVLERSAGEVEFVAIEGADRLTEVVRHAREPLGPLPREARTRELQQLGELTANVPIRRLRYPDGFERLPAVCEALADDAV
jgi:hypothetical protein